MTTIISCLRVVFLLCLVYSGSAFTTLPLRPTFDTFSSSTTFLQYRQHLLIQSGRRNSYRNDISSSSQLNAAVVVAPIVSDFADFTPLATSLFNNMKLPAAVVTAGMISLGFATGFPVLPEDTFERQYSPKLRKRCESLRRLHIVLALVSVTSELIAVLWAAVEVNQLTERTFLPAPSVWGLIQRDCDLAWSAVNSHFVIGIIGFVAMLWTRAYVMLLAAEASSAVMIAAQSGTAAALCLMISIVNRGVQMGGGEGIGYGKTILDLLQHYSVLLFQCATDADSPGALELSAIILEATSLSFSVYILLFEDDKMQDEETCPVVDLDFLDDPSLTRKEREKIDICMAIDESQMDSSETMKETVVASDSSVNVF